MSCFSDEAVVAVLWFFTLFILGPIGFKFAWDTLSKHVRVLMATENIWNAGCLYFSLLLLGTLILTANITYRGCDNCVAYVARETKSCLW